MKPARMTAILIVVLTMLGSLVASADEPSTRPAATSRPAFNPGQLRRALLRAFIAGRTSNVRPYTQQEWNDMMAFMEENAPARWHVLANLQLPDDSPVRLDAIRKWRNFNFTKEHFPAVADQLLRRFQLEDDLFALVMAAQAEGGEQVAQIRDKVRDKVSQMVQLDFSERQTRIDKLRKMLEEEQSRLARDQASQDKLIDQRTDAIMRRLDRLNRAWAPTTRPVAENAAGQKPAATTRDPIVSTSNGTDSK